jgi:hypothetical protein
MKLNPGLQNEKPSSPLSKHSPKFLTPGVGYRATTSVISEALLIWFKPAARQVWVLPSLRRVCVKYKDFQTSFGTQEDLIILVQCFQMPLIHYIDNTERKCQEIEHVMFCAQNRNSCYFPDMFIF